MGKRIGREMGWAGALCAALALAPPSSAADGGGQGTTMEFSIAHGGMGRAYLVHVPASYRAGSPAPALMAFHGGGGSMRWQASDEKYGLISKSEKEGFIAIFPNGWSPLPSGALATWNAGACCAGARDRGVDDVGFAKAVLEDVEARWSVDRSRVFAAGMSNGGMFAYRLACELPGTFAAVASVAGTDNTLSCSPSKPISVLHIHAKDDDHVLFEGGAGPAARELSKEARFRSVPSTMARWAAFDGCRGEPREVLSAPGAACSELSDCQGGARVELCVTSSGGHSWPGGGGRPGKEEPSRALSADDAMWDFFMGRPVRAPDRR